MDNNEFWAPIRNRNGYGSFILLPYFLRCSISSLGRVIIYIACRLIEYVDLKHQASLVREHRHVAHFDGVIGHEFGHPSRNHICSSSCLLTLPSNSKAEGSFRVTKSEKAFPCWGVNSGEASSIHKLIMLAIYQEMTLN